MRKMLFIRFVCIRSKAILENQPGKAVENGQIFVVRFSMSYEVCLLLDDAQNFFTI